MIVPNNAPLRHHAPNAEHSGGEARNLPIPQTADTPARHPFKGNIDVAALERLLDSDRDRVPIVMVTITNNSGGGQPVSLEKYRQAARPMSRHVQRAPLLDACRFTENAWFIKQREPGQADRPVADIVRDIFDLADGATISAKKDGLVNIGGVLLMRDEAASSSVPPSRLILTEGT
ncbi:MAG: beta-eliminating lyase-related protein [Phycisphaerales bacterium]